MSSYFNGEKRTFDHIVLVTYDGARKYWIDALIDNGTLPNLAALRAEGAETTLRIIDHNPKTDPGMACMDSGYGPDVTGIDTNYFGSHLKPSIPEGLTTTERIKAVYGDTWKAALVMPWTQDFVNVTGTADSTFWNQREETDYWFSSENVTWSLSDSNVLKNALSFSSALLRANYTAYKVAEFIHSNKDSNFYVRTHFVEPDYIGHTHGESGKTGISYPYKQALIECDQALGIIINALKDVELYDETVILVSTDHGFKGIGHGPPTYPLGDPDITETWLISNDPEVNNELGWGLQNDISPTCLGLAGIDPSIFQPFYNLTSGALPLWEANINNREMTPPSIYSVVYSTSVHEGETFNITAKIHDESGINTVQLRYLYGTIWRTKELKKENETAYSGGAGPFVEGTEVRWYLRAVDNSTSRNLTHYPENKTTLTFVVQEPLVIDSNPPLLTDIEYLEQVFAGELFNISARVQDESGITYVEVYYSIDSDWQHKALSYEGNDVYEGYIGPFDSDTEVRWYLNATDNSVNHNTSYHPPNKQPLVFNVISKGGGGFPLEFTVAGVVLALLIIVVIFSRFKRVR